MTRILSEPHMPAESWRRQLDDWIGEVSAVIEQAASWAAKRGWATRQEPKIIAEEIFGSYEAPRLLIHTPTGRLLLDPVAKSIVGAEGRIDFCVIPSYDSVAVVKSDAGWMLLPDARNGPPVAWSEETFEKASLELLKRQ